MSIYLSPGVYNLETDLSQIVQAAGASVGCMVFASQAGPMTPQYIVSDKQFLDTYGLPDSTVSLAHYSAIQFMQESAAMWALRVANTAGYSCLKYDVAAGTIAQAKFTFTGTTASASATITAITAAAAAQIPIGAVIAGAGVVTGSTVVSITIAGGASTITISNNCTAAATVSLTSAGMVDPTAYTFTGAESFLIYPVGPGDFYNDYSVSMTPINGGPVITAATGTGAIFKSTVVSGVITAIKVLNGGTGYGASGSLVITGGNGSAATATFTSTSGSINDSIVVTAGGNGYTNTGDFQVNVFANANLNNPLESFMVSKNRQKDGYGVNEYIQDRINGTSKYIQILDNTVNTTQVQAAVTTPVAFVGGSDGGAIGDSQIIAGWDVFKQADVYTVNILINGGYSTLNVQQKMDAVASGRGDAIAILDVPSASQASAAAVTWRTSTQNINSSYSALYAPDILRYDSYSDKTLYVPPSGAVAAVFARTDTVKDPWWAPAGLRRGLVKDAISLRYNYLQGDRDLMYFNQINYIQKFPGSGIAVFGQKTQQSMASALQSVNIRRLLLVLEKSMASALKYSLFEPNDPFTRSQIVQMLSGFLQDIKNRRGLYDYLVVSDDSNNPPVVIDRNELHVDVYLKPVHAAEFIRLQSVITRTGASFSELVATGGNF